MKRISMILIDCLTLITMVSLSCTTISRDSPSVPQTPIPTTVLEPASGYVHGQCDPPGDHYLLLKYYSHTRCAPACNCPDIEAPPPAIKRYDDEIIYSKDQLSGSFDPWNPSNPAMGLLIYGWFEEQLFAIDKLPFDVQGIGTPLISCNAAGTVVVQIGGEAYNLEPGQSWSSQSVQDQGSGCFLTYTRNLSNLGLFERSNFISNLGARDDFVQLELKSGYHSLEDVIAFDITVIGETNVDFSNFCSITIETKELDQWVEIGSCSAIPDYAPEPFPRLPGTVIEMKLPTSTLGLDTPYQYKLSPGPYRLKLTYWEPDGYHDLYSQTFWIFE
ncbi:MAG: hypothetical protein PVG14_12865 [Anaerolineales bacterium]|jgi:hypothetical protein